MDDLPEQSDHETDLVAVVLAAGMGTRMRSSVPKILHRVAGDPIIFHVLDAVSGAGVSNVLMVVGHQSGLVRAAVGDLARYVTQEPQLGTGHALQQAMRLLKPAPRRVLVLCGDTPLLNPSTISKLLMGPGGAAVVLLTANLQDPTGYGRVVRNESGAVLAIVEESDASNLDRTRIEINSGVYCFDGAWLADNLGKLGRSARGEYYLTDLVALAVGQGQVVRAVVVGDATEVMGVNDRFQLAEAERVMRFRLCARLMSQGVTVVDPSTTYIGKDVSVGADTVINPGTHLRGRTRVGERCEIGPNSVIADSSIGDECIVIASVLEQCELDARVSVGPFSHLRPGARIASGARIGNYAEVKNSSIGEDVQMHHFSYVGDAEVGRGTNVGAGTITCNFDGVKKQRTRVGKGVFLGSDTLLVAPLEVGDEARTGAGAVVTRDVPAGKLVVGVPARVAGVGKARDTRHGDKERQEGGESGG